MFPDSETWSWDTLQGDVSFLCSRSTRSPILYDRKLRVFKTGRDKDPYVFLGGMQLNLNVGQGFSVSRSKGYNWSFGVGAELFDILGPAKAITTMSSPAGVLAPAAKQTFENVGNMIKPFNAKLGAGYGESFGDSEGTSVSDSTYLVAQIAGFKVRLDQFERCVVLRMNPEFHPLILQFAADPRWGNFLRQQVDYSTGVLVCEGQMNKEPRYVKESFYYFTQHFTEGDMLDQADLYNHPWLLALRGQRDFATFLKNIRGQQEKVTLGGFIKGVWSGSHRTLDWPLDHMLKVYRGMTPAFPGIYTELREGEAGAELPLERVQQSKGSDQPTLSRIDEDVNCELTSSRIRVLMPGQAPLCDPKYAR